MKRFKDEARETMPEGATPLDPKDLEQKGLFSQNILLKGDVIELPDELSSDYFCEGKPFKTRVKNKETGEIEDGVIRPTLIFVHRNGAPIWMPLGNFCVAIVCTMRLNIARLLKSTLSTRNCSVLSIKAKRLRFCALGKLSKLSIF